MQVQSCETHIIEREKNLGLGTSIFATGVTEIFQKHNAIIVIEDDLICAPGTTITFVRHWKIIRMILE